MSTFSVGVLVAGAGLVSIPLLGHPPRGRRPRRPRWTPLARLGASTRRRVVGRLPSLDSVGDRALGAATILTLVSGVLAPPIALLPPVAIGAVGVARTRAAGVRHRQAIDRGMVQLVDLLALAVAGGLPLRRAFSAVAPRLPSEHRILALALLDRVERGEGFVAGLGWYGGRLGPGGRELTAILISSERDGAPLAAGLERAAGATRRSQRRDLERRARRLPVTLLLPLVCCVLPAFVVLTLVPLLAGTLGDLQFPT